MSIPYSVGKYLGFLFVIFTRKERKDQQTIVTDLILDHIEWTEALERFKGLIDLFGESNVVAIAPGRQKVNYREVLVVNRPRFIGYRITLAEFRVMLRGMFFFLTISLRVRTNLLAVSVHMLNSFFYYRTLFENIKGKHCLIYQHYHTNAIKNYLFHRYGGVSSGCIQKNILEAYLSNN